MELGLEHKAVVVTGGASHIGQAIVFGFAAERARIAIVDKDLAQARRTADEARRRGAALAEVVGADLTDSAAAEQACARAMDALGGIEILAANVGANW